MSLEEAIRRLAPAISEFEPGHVWLAGAGPGSAGCLTIDVVSALSQADAIVYDALVDSSILAAARKDATLHFAGKRGGDERSARQDDITALLVHLARERLRVLRLKGGDPCVFGRGGEEALGLAQAGVPFRILPGVTSAFAAMASAGIPATMRGVNKAIVLATGHAADSSDDLDWSALARTGQPIAIYMGLKNIEQVTGALLSGGLSPATPAAVIVAATTASQQVVVGTLADIVDRCRQAGVASPALIVVGEIVALRAQLNEVSMQAKSA